MRSFDVAAKTNNNTIMRRALGKSKSFRTTLRFVESYFWLCLAFQYLQIDSLFRFVHDHPSRCVDWTCKNGTKSRHCNLVTMVSLDFVSRKNFATFLVFYCNVIEVAFGKKCLMKNSGRWFLLAADILWNRTKKRHVWPQNSSKILSHVQFHSCGPVCNDNFCWQSQRKNIFVLLKKVLEIIRGLFPDGNNNLSLTKAVLVNEIFWSVELVKSSPQELNTTIFSESWFTSLAVENVSTE